MIENGRFLGVELVNACIAGGHRGQWGGGTYCVCVHV